MINTHDWLWETRHGVIVRHSLKLFAPAIGFLVSLWLIYQTEARFFPVISEWRLEYAERSGPQMVTVGGSFKKTRACELVATTVLAVPKNPITPRQTPFTIPPDSIIGGNVPTGHSTWGPWEFKIPAMYLTHKDHISHLLVVGHHRCHALWIQETVYGHILPSELPI